MLSKVASVDKKVEWPAHRYGFVLPEKVHPTYTHVHMYFYGVYIYISRMCISHAVVVSGKWMSLVKDINVFETKGCRSCGHPADNTLSTDAVPFDENMCLFCGSLADDGYSSINSIFQL